MIFCLDKERLFFTINLDAFPNVVKRFYISGRNWMMKHLNYLMCLKAISLNLL